MQTQYDPPLGASLSADGTAHFLVWAPGAREIALHLVDDDRYVPMEHDERGYFTCTLKGIQPGARYLYQIDGDKERPDPASRGQPDGVHGASAVVSTDFKWTDAGWNLPSMRNSVMYELHVGTYTPEGTFDALIPHLDRLRDLGITTLQLMPITNFPGGRNWGYDGVNPYAPSTAYGGPDGLHRLVDAAHNAGLAVMLDVVYNHLGPEGNYLWDYGPYFTDRYHSPWGDAVNLDGPGSDAVRRYLIENAIYWLDTFHIDGLRLDATHALFDSSARPFLAELADTVHHWAEAADRRVYLIAENDRSDRRLLLPPAVNGWGLDGQWLDDLHHVVHNALTGETDGYYADYGTFDLLAKVLREGFAYSGQYSPYRDRTHGTPSGDIPADRFVVATQTHDQVGNRMLGERLAALVDFESLKLAAGILCCSPYVPMLFMGQEYAETAPFLYFVSHGDPDLVQAVQEGRRAEFAAFEWRGTPPDPQAEETFQTSKLDHTLRERDHHALLYRFYETLLALRHDVPALTNPRRDDIQVYADEAARIIALDRRDGTSRVRVVLNFNLEAAATLTLPSSETAWRKWLDSASILWTPSEENRVRAPRTLPAETTTPVTLPPRAFVIYVPEGTDIV